MDLFLFLKWLNNDVFAVPATLLFFGVGIILTLKLGFIQIRAFPRFFSLITKGVVRRKHHGEAKEMKTINSFHALFTAMATTIGMGNMVGPSVAIMIGGPGALFWLIVYIFFGAVTKFAEVTFALHTRTRTAEGDIIGGPIQYLKSISSLLSYWYGYVIIFLFAGWSSAQSNTLANIFMLESIPQWVVGLALAAFVFVALSGGAKRVGALASKMVPFMFILYVSFALFILFQDTHALYNAFGLVIDSIISPTAAIAGFAGATMLQAMRAGLYKGIFISEAGLGTSSIPHAVADTKHAVDQGILAMCSTVADVILSIISGLLILVTGVWNYGDFRSTLIYEAFEKQAPMGGQYILLISITLFVLTTAIGNSFNGSQTFASLTKDKWVKGYMGLTALAIFFGALVPLKSIWPLVDCLIALVAVPNVLGILYLAFKYPKVLQLPKNN